jgi:lauroyl/myristoyl acyltransferase
MARSPRRNLRAVFLPRLARIVQRVPAPLALGARPLLRGALSMAPGLTVRLREAMDAGLGPHPERARHIRDYVAHTADLIALSAVVFRSGVTSPLLKRFYTHDPEAHARYLRLIDAGRGILMVSPHLVGHEIMAGTVTQVLPVTVLVRRSPDEEYEALKQRWYASIGVEVAYRAQKGSQFQGLGDMTAALRALRKNRVLAITPDLVQKAGTGVPVQFLGRDLELPAGAFFLAARAGAPLVPSFFHVEDGRYRLWSYDPLSVATAEGEDRDASIARLAQEWASLFETFVREHPDMWQFWLDKRWRRWLGLSR